MIWLELYKSLREIREEKKLKKYKIAVIPGDGIGVEAVSYTHLTLPTTPYV